MQEMLAVFLLHWLLAVFHLPFFNASSIERGDEADQTCHYQVRKRQSQLQQLDSWQFAFFLFSQSLFCIQQEKQTFSPLACCSVSNSLIRFVQSKQEYFERASPFGGNLHS
jgi:hypothetical protein